MRFGFEFECRFFLFGRSRPCSRWSAYLVFVHLNSTVPVRKFYNEKLQYLLCAYTTTSKMLKMLPIDQVEQENGLYLTRYCLTSIDRAQTTAAQQHL